MGWKYRRSSERFCKARAAQPSRKSAPNKKSTPPLPRQSSSTDSETKGPEFNENTYKYDITTMKSERRGFTSSKRTDIQQTTPMAISSVDEYDEISSSLSDHNDNNDYTEFMPTKSPNNTIEYQSLPWDYTHQSDDLPVKSQRFADNKFDHVNNSRGTDLKVHSESFAISYSAFAKGENLKARELMKSSALPSIYISPDERLKHINKRLNSLKKRVATFEENYEMENGYRPSHSIKINDRYVKNALAEIHKLRKEKQAIKSDPMVAMGLKTIQSADEQKVNKMKETIAEIEKVNTSNIFITLYYLEMVYFLITLKNSDCKQNVLKRSDHQMLMK